ncbi:endo alpha-1,4 polygalactosaminidase [Saccharothrix variisporea]|uniref:Glycoside-hydrolase family GH114 TIM-barrel domain-containing protein n=1 Tax=Saccharothrix variisporea TaxID=543527 RepID=A0A495X1Z4_9PSEU|nr:endo alpha-1,4 polygalactosaminidase [Saccharothrix variisporea]RKT67569.1 hypothetical protein DFJ66_0744 [Saccharothrix variisporea]
MRTSTLSAVLAVSALALTACTAPDATALPPTQPTTTWAATAPPTTSPASPPPTTSAPPASPVDPPAVVLPPAHAGFDYQIGGPYPPAEGVSVVTRDHQAPPAPGRYSICYLNAFQVQPGAEAEWDADLLLRDAAGQVVYDRDWDEALLDIRTTDKRDRIARKVGDWIDGCAAKGYRAVEPDNYDSYTRAPQGLLTSEQAKALHTLLSARAHAKGLAIGQKNTVELAGDRQAVGVDFAIAEECGQHEECGEYVEAFGDRVLVIEYTDEGLATACAGWGTRLSIVRRDVNVLPADNPAHVRRTC